MNHPDFLHKLTPRAAVPGRMVKLPQPVVFTNGVFDVLHRGHAVYLAQARALGASLIVALNTDGSAKRLGKGGDRPINNETDRAVMLAAMEAVSLVTWFDEDTPIEMIRDLRPAILCKGGDYDMAKLPEARFVESYGGRAVALPFVEGYSTTSLVQRIRQRP